MKDGWVGSLVGNLSGRYWVRGRVGEGRVGGKEAVWWGMGWRGRVSGRERGADSLGGNKGGRGTEWLERKLECLCV